MEGKGRVIAINTTIRRAPFADVLYAGDFKWWCEYEADWRDFGGLKFTVSPAVSVKWPDIVTLKMRPREVLADSGLATGNNSAYQAVNLAYLFGARKIYLLGVDCKAPSGGQAHWHADHNTRSTHRLTNPTKGLFRQWAQNFSAIHAALAEKGVKLVNCSRDTALTIPWARLEDIL